jgi:hypothetical protein
MRSQNSGIGNDSGILRGALAALGWRMLHDFLISVDLWKGVHWRLNRSSLGG